MNRYPWPANETGPCGSRREPTRRYGPQDSTLCPSRGPQASAPRISSSPGPASASHAHIRDLSPEPDQLELFA
jgi:hypothetical protein